MELVQQFFQGLDGPASTTFLGLLFASFLLGLLPAGLIYAFRIRSLQRSTEKHIGAHRKISQERNVLKAHLVKERDQARLLIQKNRASSTEISTLKTELLHTESNLNAAKADALAIRAQQQEREEYVNGLRGKVSSLTAQVQSLKAAAKPKAQPTAFDLNAMASLTTARSKVTALEQRVELLTADNEKLRRQLTS